MIYYLAGKFGFVESIDEKTKYVHWTTDVRKAMVFSSFENADLAAKETILSKHYYAILTV